MKRLCFKNSFLPTNYAHILKNNVVFEKLKSWNGSISFFITFSILPFFSETNKNRLKNIFCSIIQDLRVWREITFMFDFNILGFKYNDLYFTSFKSNSNSLSLILFEIYISEFDFYIFNLSRYFFYKYSFYKDLFYCVFSKRKSKKVLPLFLKKFNRLSNNNNLSFSESIFKYNRSLDYLRYVGYFFLGVVSSVFVLKKLELKFISFIRGNLLLEITDLSIFSSHDRNIILGGFNISFYSNKLDNFLDKKKVLSNSIFLKLNKFKLNFSKSFVTRFYFEFLFRLENLTFSSIQRTDLLNKKNFWLFFLFSESLRLFNMKSSYNSFISLNFNYKYSYLIYYFNYYVFLVKKILSSFDLKIFPTSILPLDLSFNSILNEFKNNLFIINNDLLDLFDSKVKFIRSYFTNEKSFFSGIIFSNQDVLFLSYSFYFKSFFVYDTSIILFIPLKMIIYRLRLLGIFHFFKHRPIGSSYFMFQHDELIFQFFSLLFFSFLFWYNSHLVSNFLKMYFIFRIIYYSFLLTISRKHNKSISWSYAIYRKVNLTNFEHYFLNSDEFLNERFFLTF